MTLILLLAACDPELPKDSDPVVVATDDDLDGVTAEADCDDDDAAISPDADEVCDGVDNNCDGVVDDEDPQVQGATSGYLDGDGDGFGATALVSCDARDLVATDGDCDDSNNTLHPGASEGCDGIDNDCDTLVDDADPDWDPASGATWYPDVDGDSYGESAGAMLSCGATAGLSAIGDDCDDGDPAVNPAAAEICDNGIDDNCDGGGAPCVPEGSGTTADADASFMGGVRGDTTGYVVALPGDVMGDVYGDVVIGGPALSGGVKGQVQIIQDPVSRAYDLGIDSTLTITGAAADDWFGTSVDTGDVDGDGIADLLVGAVQDNRGGDDAGAAYLFRGPFTAGTATADDAGTILFGTTTELWAGYDVAFAGDTDGNGVNELLIGAAAVNDSMGAAFLIEDPGAGTWNLETDALRFSGGNIQEMAGSRVHPFGDLDGDGVADVGVGAFYYSGGTGRVYIQYGPVTSDMALNDFDVIVEADGAASNFGMSVDSEDIDGDGLPDFVFGSPLRDVASYNEGVVHVVQGPFMRGVHYVGSEAYARYDGYLAEMSVGGALGLGDVDGDEILDLVIGSSCYRTSATYSGAVLYVRGPFASDTLANADAIWIAERAGGLVGHAIAVGEVDNNGYEDFLAGGPYDSPSGRGLAGSAWLFFGSGG